MLSHEVLLPEEDAAALEELGERLRAELQPVGELEGMLVDRIIASYWRLRRLGRVEAGIFAWEFYGELAERARQEARAHEKTGLDQVLEDTGLPTVILNQRRHKAALSEAKEMEAVRDGETAHLDGPSSGTRTKRTLSPSSRATKRP